MEPRPLAYVCVRPQRDASDGEYRSFSSAMQLELERWDLLESPLPADFADRFAGVVIGGSPFNVTDADPGELQRRVEGDLETLAGWAIDGRISGMFTCYSIGVVTRMLGGEVTTDASEGTGPTPVILTGAGTEDPVFGAVPRVFEAITAHKEGALQTPPGAVLLATNERCPVQAYRIGQSLYTTQFHPEPTPEDFTARMQIYRDAGYFDPEEFDSVAARVLAAGTAEPRALLARFAALATGTVR